jgi:hypothetical protein
MPFLYAVAVFCEEYKIGFYLVLRISEVAQ